MENDKPSYQEIEKELNDYKELLWQLSDEYKLNVGIAEKLVEEHKAKYLELKESIELNESAGSYDYLSGLGLPACVFDNEGIMLKHNNKFKFLVELLSIEIEEVSSISVLFNKSKLDNLPEKFRDYIKNEEGLLQSLFRVENSFQGIINLVVRVYNIGEKHEHLALFLELSKPEIKNLCLGQNEFDESKKEEHSGKNPGAFDEDFAALKIEISIFSEKHELFEEISKSAEFTSESKAISKTLSDSLKRHFNLENTRTKLIEKLNLQFKQFIVQINQNFPALTNNEEKHCLLIKAGLTYKEIAAIMGITINGVKIARNRLRKKFDLENDTKTSDFIEKI